MIIIILAIAIVFVAIAAVFFTFFYTKNCKDEACWKYNYEKCVRASYVDDREDAAWSYQILGKKTGNCNVLVSLLQLKKGDVNMAELEDKSMICSPEIGDLNLPQSNLENCHGLLKEEMQKLMINKLFNYVLDNVGQISDELKKAI